MSRICLLLTLIGASGLALGSAGAQTATKAVRTTKLRAAVEKLVAVIANGSPEDFLDIVSSKGINFTYDQSPVPLAEIKEDFAKKTGIYCHLLDTACLRAELARRNVEDFEKYLSSRDKIRALILSPSHEIHISKENETSGIGVLCVMRAGKCDSSRVAMFFFRLENGEWKLSVFLDS